MKKKIIAIIFVVSVIFTLYCFALPIGANEINIEELVESNKKTDIEDAYLQLLSDLDKIQLEHPSHAMYYYMCDIDNNGIVEILISNVKHGKTTIERSIDVFTFEDKLVSLGTFEVGRGRLCENTKDAGIVVYNVDWHMQKIDQITYENEKFLRDVIAETYSETPRSNGYEPPYEFMEGVYELTYSFVHDELLLRQYFTDGAENITADYLTKYYWYIGKPTHMKYRFNKDGTGLLCGLGKFQEFCWTLEGNTLKMLYDNEDDGAYTPNELIYIKQGEISECVYYKRRINDTVSYNEKVFWVENSTDAMRNSFEEVLEDEVTVMIRNGSTDLISFDQPPIMLNDRVLVPIRAIFEELGYTLEWDGESKTAVAVNGDKKITVTEGDANIYHNDGVYICDVAPVNISGRLLVPVRAIGETAGCEVCWIESAKTVYIEKPYIPTIVPEGAKATAVPSN